MYRYRLLCNQHQSNFIKFKDIELTKLCISLYDKDKDGRFSISDAAAVTNINQIIQYFCTNNNLENSFIEFKYFTRIIDLPVSFFDSCKLSEIQLPETIQKLGQFCFSNNKIKKIIIPKSCNIVEGSIFEGNEIDCTVIFENKTPPIARNNFFLNRYTKSKIVAYVPNESLELYKNVINWKDYKNQIHPISEYNEGN